MALDTRYSVQIGLLPAGGEERVHALLKRLGFHLWHPALEARDARRPLADPRRPARSSASTSAASSPSRCCATSVAAKRSTTSIAAEILQAMAWLRRRETGAVRLGGRPSHATAPTSTRASPGPRSARNLERYLPRGQAPRLPGRALRRRPAAVGGSRASAARARRAGRIRRLPARERSVRLHDQRLSLRPVPRHAA